MVSLQWPGGAVHRLRCPNPSPDLVFAALRWLSAAGQLPPSMRHMTSPPGVKEWSPALACAAGSLGRVAVRRVKLAPKRSGPGEGLHGPLEVFGAIPVIAVPAEARRGGGEQDDAVAAGPIERGTGGLVEVVALADVEVRGPLAEGVGDARPALGHAQHQQVRPTA